jgi:hypothetical protein
MCTSACELNRECGRAATSAGRRIGYSVKGIWSNPGAHSCVSRVISLDCDSGLRLAKSRAASLAPPAFRECRHGFLARRLVAIGRPLAQFGKHSRR